MNTPRCVCVLEQYRCREARRAGSSSLSVVVNRIGCEFSSGAGSSLLYRRNYPFHSPPHSPSVGTGVLQFFLFSSFLFGFVFNSS